MTHQEYHADEHVNGEDDIQNATSSQKGLATSTQITKLDSVASSADVTGSNSPQNHAAGHTDATDDIQSATSAQKGLATSTQITKLDGITAGATNKRTIAISWASDRDVNLTANTGAHRIPITDDGTLVIKKVRAMMGTAPTGAAIILDIHKNGTTIFTTQGNRPTIAIDGHDSGEVTNMDVTTVTKGDYLTLDTDQIGSTIAGQNLVVRLDYEVTPS